MQHAPHPRTRTTPKPWATLWVAWVTAGITAGVTSLSAAQVAAATPAAPPGWQVVDDSPTLRYRPVGRPEVELRLMPAEAAQGDLASWFAQRLRRGGDGLSAVNFGATSALGGQALMAMGRTASGADRWVVATGCQGPSGRMHFSLLLLSPDSAQVERDTRASAAVLQAVCTESAQAAALRRDETQAAPAARTAQPVQPVQAAQAAQATPAPSSGRTPTGLDPASIHSVLYAFRLGYEHDGMKMREWTYLLLKGGSARRGVPRQAPADFDLLADRQQNPQDWGRWRRKGQQVQVAIGQRQGQGQGQGQDFSTPPGQMLRMPGRPGERLAGLYETTSSYTQGSEVAMWFSWGLQLRADGSYRRWNHRGSAVASGSGSSRNLAMSSSDDKGASTSVSGPSFAGTTRGDTGVTDNDLEGTYHIEGWTLTLRSRSGQVRHGFFFTDERRQNIGFEGNELGLRKAK